MEIVIKIPEEKYKAIQKCFESGFTLGSLDMAILSGTVLPKGHGRLIDADKLETRTILYEPRGMEGMLMRYADLLDAPTIIEADKEVEE